MEVTNAQILQSQEALQTLVQTKLPAIHALTLRDAVEEVQGKVESIQEVRKDLMQREDMGEEEMDEEWRQLLSDTTELDADPLPQEALEDVEISTQTLLALDWLIDRG